MEVLTTNLKRNPCVYILTNKPWGTLYAGVTAFPVRRIWEHKSGLGSDFVWQHRLGVLAWIEWNQTMDEAIRREKRLKKWRRSWKIRLIMVDNPKWVDMYDSLLKSLSGI